MDVEYPPIDGEQNQRDVEQSPHTAAHDTVTIQLRHTRLQHHHLQAKKRYKLSSLEMAAIGSGMVNRMKRGGNYRWWAQQYPH